jgi:hypothetical protein
MDKGLRSQILRLLLRSHDGIKVEVRPSEILSITSIRNSTKVTPTLPKLQNQTVSEDVEFYNARSAGMGVFTTADSIQKGHVS